MSVQLMARWMNRILWAILLSVSSASLCAEGTDSMSVPSASLWTEGTDSMSVPSASLWTEGTDSVPVPSASLWTQATDSVSDSAPPRFIYSLGGGAGINHLMNIEMRGEKLVKRGWGSNYSVYFDWQANPRDSAFSPYDRFFGFPTLEVGLQLLDYSHTRLHTGDTPYMSTLGLVWTAYVAFRRDIYRNRRWSFGYELENGFALSSRTYEPDNNVDNDMIGQHISMYFGFGLHAGYRISPEVEVSLGVEYKHVSNGATDRPNKGSNAFGLVVRTRCDVNRPSNDRGLTHEQRRMRLRSFAKRPFDGEFYLDVNASVGFRTMYEEWLLHRDFLTEGEPGYLDGSLGLHTVWSAQLVPMFRYNRVHASGLGLEYSFAGYTGRSVMIEHQMELSREYSHSKHTLGIAAHHEVFYKQLSLAMSLGTYLFRQHGWVQGKYEPSIYETVGIRYYPKFFRPFYLGYNVKANGGKAYAMELKVGLHAGRWRLKKNR